MRTDALPAMRLLLALFGIGSCLNTGAGAEVAVQLNPTDGRASLLHQGVPRLGEINISGYLADGPFSSTDAEGARIAATGVTASTDSVGAFQEFTTAYPSPKGEFRRHLRIYRENGMSVLGVSFATPAPDLDPARSVSVDVGTVPGFRRGLGFSVEHFPSRAAAGQLFAQFPRDINQVGNRQITDLRQMPRGENFFLWQEADGTYGAAVPLNTAGCRGWIGNDQDTAGLQFFASSFHAGHALTRVDVALIAFGDDPHALVAKAYAAALRYMGASGRLRPEKVYPEPFDYLGWCTWEAFRQDINAERIRQSARTIAAKGVPVQWVLIDDGWQDVDGRKLAGLGASPDRFPDGLGALVDELKHTGAIRWVGVWHTLMGYWDGIAPDSPLGHRYRADLVPAPDGVWFPAPGAGAYRFFNDWYAELRQAGVDFTKVDDQTRIGPRTAGIAAIDHAGAGLLDALEAASSLHMATTLNCMAMSPACAYHWGRSAIVRVSLDYRANNAARSRLALTNALYNPLWLANFGWPDGDMFYSSERYAPLHAIARAIGGGPIYLSDPPDDIIPAVVSPLCLADGRILRADQPALPTRDSLFIDPMTEALLAKSATSANGTGVVGLFNLYEGDETLSREVSGRDLPASAVRSDRYFVYSHDRDSGQLIGAQETFTSHALPPMTGDLLVFAPVMDGIALIGLADKLLSPAAIAHVSRERHIVRVTLHDDGVFAMWMDETLGPWQVLLNGTPVAVTPEHGLIRLDTRQFPGANGHPRIELRR